MRSVVWRAPGRVNLIGEHTDYNDGFALPFAIGQGCTARVEPLSDPLLHMESAQQHEPVEIPLRELRPGSVSGWAAYVAGVVAPIWSRHDLTTGVSVALDSDVPVGAGLSSSAAVVCAVATALNDALDLQLSTADLIALTRSAENDFVGAPTGGMDQLASICSRRGAALLCDMQTLTTRHVPMDLDAAGLALLVVDTRAPHGHADGEYSDRRAACRRAAELLGVVSLREVQNDEHGAVLARLGAAAGADSGVLVRRVRHVLTENDRTLRVAELLDSERLADIGSLLTQSHASMRDDYEITVPEVDLAVETALRAGALGARMTGGGFGGCVIALCPDELVPDVRRAISAAFAAAGFGAPEQFVTSASDGAHRLG